MAQVSWKLGLAVILAFGVAGCGPHPAKKNFGVKKVAIKVGKAPKTANIGFGKKVFSAACASCHGKTGMGTSNGVRLAVPSTVAKTYGTESKLEVFIAHNMPASDPGSLTPVEAQSAAMYVWKLAGK